VGGVEPDFRDLNLQALVEMRLQHRTEQASNGVRLLGKGNSDCKAEVPMRRQIIQTFHRVLKEQQSAVLALVANVLLDGTNLHLLDEDPGPSPGIQRMLH
jgi:hypothetical protein